jgi:hypothetical protein
LSRIADAFAMAPLCGIVRHECGSPENARGDLRAARQAGVRWRDIEALFAALGATLEQGRGSRVRISLNGVDADFHRPHPRPETDKGALKSVRRFLTEAGVKP